MKLHWLSCDSRKGNSYAGVNFRDVRMLTFSVIQRYGAYTPKSGKPEWVVLVGKEPIGTFANRGMAQVRAQQFLDDFIRGLFASEDYDD